MPALLQLSFDDQWGFSVPVEPRLLEAVAVQFQYAEQSANDKVFVARLANVLGKAISECLDADLHLPSAKQLKFATDIARELNIALPGEVLRYRGATNNFIKRFSAAFQRSRSGNSNL
jgi:hypothetical protein